MPICIPHDLPARAVLQSENIFVMGADKAVTQDIRPLRAVIMNLMPTKIVTETQLLRLLGNTPLQVEVDLLKTTTYEPRNTPAEHLLKFYAGFDEVRDNFYDLMIITGAPVEKMDYRDVGYWEELCEIFDWAQTHVYSTLYICWAAQAALFHHYNIDKRPLDAKRFGVFNSRVLEKNSPLLCGFDDGYCVPHSHHTEITREDLAAAKDVELLTWSPLAGPDLAATRDLRKVFSFGHCEYDTDTLDREYRRDLDAGLDIALPCGYYTDDDPGKPPLNRWRGHANLLFSNWTNNVYQLTPFDISKGFGAV